jgi:amino acid adenylation domain-containing protein/non-ribosomal peptide synthase protein (TIGR01720 family)
VCVSHAAVVRLVCASDYVRLGTGDRVAQAAHAAFDAVSFEVWGPLLNGGVVELVSREELLDPARFAAQLRSGRFTALFLTTALFNRYAAHDPAMFAGVGTVLFGGEAVDPRPVAAVLAAGAPRRLLHAYGPTESTTFATWHEVERVAADAVTIPIGRPVANTTAYVLDGFGAAVPVGVVGELYLGGAGLAQGYRNRPELTTERFVQHADYGRLYRTGDLCRRLADGSLVFVGRADNQIKLRGFRIEPGEVEAALRRLPGVGDAALAVHGAGERRRLVGYVVLAGAAAEGEDAAGLRAELRRELPEAMVPSQIIAVPCLPLTANGKLDRDALPAPGGVAGESFAPPRPGIEEKMAAVWSAVLRRDAIGRHDNFFALGGDSIVSIQIVARARQLGFQFAVADLFRYQTLAELAPHLTEAAALATPAAAEPGELVPLTPIQCWFFAQDPPDPGHFNLSVLLRLRRTVLFSAVHQALHAVSRQHGALRLRFVETNASWTQSYAADSAVTLHEEDLRDLPADQQPAALEARASHWQRSLDLVAGPSMQTVLFLLSDGQRLLWCVHHLCVDAVSWRILLQDFEFALTAAARGEEPQLPPPTAPFSTWSHYLEALAASPELRAEVADWSKLRGSLCLPTDFAPPEPPRLASAAQVSFGLAAAETRALLDEAPAAYRTRINELLLTGLVIALAGWTGRRRLVLDIEGHGRSQRPGAPDVSWTVGWFTSIHPVEITLPESDEPGGCIKAVKEQLRAIPIDGIGYGLLHYLTPSALPSRPLSPIVFNYLGQFASVPDEGLLAFASESSGESRSPNGRRTHPINIDALVREGALTVAIGYSTEQFRPESIERLADGFRGHLQAVIEHCCDAASAGYTASDFPLARATQTALDELAVDHGRSIEALYALSPMQHGMLFHTLYAEAGDAYFEQLHARIDGFADMARFYAAWQKLIARHAVLRTAFLLEWDPPVQIVLKEVQAPWHTADWRGIDESRQRQMLDRLLANERARGFDLARAPLMRFHLLRLGEHSIRFVWCFHHVLLDGWSLPLLFEELFALYQDRTADAPPRPLFQDYIAWYLGRDRDAATSYWRGYLEGFEAPTPLPAVRAVSARAEAYAEVRFALDESATAEILRFAAERGLTIGTVLQGAWALVLQRYCGETDLAYGVTVSGRDIDLVGSERIIGLLINTIPLRATIDATPLGDWLQQLQAQQIESRRWAFMPLSEIQACSALPNATRLFDNILVFENYPVETISKAQGPDRLRFNEVTPVDHTSYPLAVIASADTCLRFRIGYDAGRFAPENIEGLFATLRAALVALARSLPDTPVQALAPLDPAEAERIRGWSLARAPGMPVATLVELFAQQVRRNPGRVAVTHGDTRLTYAELDARARRLARRLRRLRADSGGVVGLYLEPTPELVVGILCILQSGAAYLPLDPTLPAARLRFMLADAQAAALITQRTLQPQAAEFGIPHLVVDGFEEGPGSEAEDAAPALLPSDLAYVIYTSGSTGEPKGVAVTHANVARLFAATEARFGFSTGDVWTLFHSFAFDFSVWEIWGALLYGGRLVVVPQDISRDPHRFHALLGREGVTVLNQTPSAFRQLIPAAEAAGATLSLRLVIFGGEVLDLPSLRPWCAVYGDERPRLVNMYGITETTVHVTELALRAGDAESAANLIGRPLADLDLFLLDRQCRPAPIGAIGEIHVGGAGLARGYLNRPELTAQRFVEIDLFGEPRRLYRSGDLARWRGDGSIEFLGRADDQVKLRGFRIELGEIEASLAQHPEVREVVVVSRGSDAHQLLAAYVVCAEGEGASEAALREWLAARVPLYMLPARFIVLARLPLTRNGKIDRRALPEPGAGDGSRPLGVAPPRSPGEEALVRIWCDALGLTTIGIDDDFFALGGHSLIAMRVTARIHHELRVRIPVRWIFEHPTIAALAPLIANGERETPAAITSVAPQPDYPLSHAQQRLWLDHQVAGAANYNMPEALAFAQRLDVDALARSFATIVERHEALRTRFTVVDGEPRQSVLDRLDVTIREFDLTSSSDADAGIQAILDAEAVAPFDLAAPPLIRLALIHQPGGRDVLLIVPHHIVGDGWSRNLLHRELATLYRAYGAGQSDPLPPLAIQYKDYAVWESGRSFAREEGYWVAKLAGAPTRIALPHDLPGSAGGRFRGDRRERLIAPATAEALRALGMRCGTSLSNVLLALFKLLLFRISAQQEICLGIIAANRSHAVLESLIGCFVNILPIRTRLAPEMEFDDLLRQVTVSVQEALDHQSYPYDLLVRHLDRGDGSAARPFIDVIYVYQSAVQARTAIGGNAAPDTNRPIALLDFAFAFAKAELCLNIADHGGGGIGLTLEYDTDLFTAPTIDRHLAILDQFARSVAG